jgi:putative flippase GtrA
MKILRVLMAKEWVRYLLVAATNTVSTYVLFVLLLNWLPYPLSYSLVYVGGIFLAYTLNSYFVFYQPLSWRKALQYPLVYVVQYLIGLGVISFLVEGLHVDPRLGALLNVVITLPITFVLSRLIITPRRETVAKG